MPVVAPAGPGPTLLHWLTAITAACAGVADRLRTPVDSPVVRRTATAKGAQIRRRAWRAEVDVGIDPAVR